MAMPDSWVDFLFAKLTVRWGEAFMRQWPADTDPAFVKADWAEVLDGVSRDSLSYVLRYLPAAPCNALQFRELCRRAAPSAPAALPGPKVRADPERVQAIVARVARAPARDGAPARYCADRILAIARSRGSMSHPQRAQLVAMAAYMTEDQRRAAAPFVPELRVNAEGP